ncbi:phosphatase PAP2 family protein [Candidatus Saccharibacteria bacterium]|nr:phosphatase PAP2 family protein [Candidatus Saccharibacteria bacterium]NIV03259.1 phosphatase PAP2 family protein [Calditrichia bacterium]NIS37778.1 phosphatase PAP2 family protein [Candidatus Saccharibacteria bacterium]NIV71417.1 phosphatase PAP2 family protein [Calditrichia bacterium]NIV97937.1 phosphatase PAP2 family protein [Candidatus Saccharibacteria bacterium]
MKFDHLLFKKINDFAGENSLSDWVGIFGARYLIVIIIASLLKYVFVYKDKAERLVNIKVVFNAIFSAGLGLLFNFIVSIFIQRSRPFEIGLGENIYGSVWTAGSFPSEHTTIAFAIALAVFLTYKKFGTILLVLAAIVGISRVYVGVHYPLDVAAGALVGIAMAYLTVKWLTPAMLHIKKRGKA